MLFLTPLCSSYWKGSLQVTFNFGRWYIFDLILNQFYNPDGVKKSQMMQFANKKNITQTDMQEKILTKKKIYIVWK